MLKKAVGQFFTWVGVLGMFAFGIIRTMLDVVGYSTAQGDAAGLPAAAQAFFLWLLGLPWWVPWVAFMLAFMWLCWWSWAPLAQHPSSEDKSFWEKPAKPSPTDVLLDLMEKARRSFLAMAESLDANDRPSTLPSWNAFKEQMVTVQISIEKAGLTAPWLNPETDPLGWMERNGRYFNRITPMMLMGHTNEAKAESAALSAKLQNEHPGPNGRQALQ